MTIAEGISRVVVVVVSASRNSVFGYVWQHRHPLLFERGFVLVFDGVVYDVLEHLDDQKKKNVCAIHEGAVLAVGFTVRHEHPQALHNFAFRNHGCCIPIRLVPYML